MITFLAWITIIIVSTFLGTFIRSAVRDGPPKVIEDNKMFGYLLVNTIIGFIALMCIYRGISQLFY